MRVFSLALACVLILTGCNGKTAHKASKHQASVMNSSQISDARFRAKTQLMINHLNDILEDLHSQGIEVRHSPNKRPWRLIVPALAQVSDPKERQAQARGIAASFKKRVETLMHHPIEVAVYATPQELQQLN